MTQLKSFLCSVALLFAVPAAFAHTHISNSVPANNSELAVAPKEIKLAFEGEVQLTAVKLTLANGEAVALKPLPTDTVKEATLPLPKLSAGNYVVNWRAMGHDGHVMSGEVRFSIIAK